MKIVFIYGLNGILFAPAVRNVSIISVRLCGNKIRLAVAILVIVIINTSLR